MHTESEICLSTAGFEPGFLGKMMDTLANSAMLPLEPVES
jgi:hypothetical protein